MNAEKIKKNRHAFDFGLNGGKIWVNEPLWELRRFDELSFNDPDTFYIADDDNAEFAKAIVDGKGLECFGGSEKWIDSIFNYDSAKVLREGLAENCKYRIRSERWKPEMGKVFYHINNDVECDMTVNQNWKSDNAKIDCGNCFETAEICNQAIAKVKETLNKFHEEN